MVSRKRKQRRRQPSGLAHALRVIARGELPRDPPHPGTVLLDEYLWPNEISQNALARHIGVPPRRINEIVLGKRGITADTALRLAAAFFTSPRYWMKLQAEFDLAAALRRGEPQLHGALGPEVDHRWAG